MRFADPIETFCRTASDRELADKLKGWESVVDVCDDWEARKWTRELRDEVDARKQVKAFRARQASRFAD